MLLRNPVHPPDEQGNSIQSTQKKAQPIYTKGSCFDSMRHQKMISLDGECLKIADTIENFSGWVRAQLHKYNEEHNPSKKWSYVCHDCERVFTYQRDMGDETICRNQSCKRYAYDIGRYYE